MSEPNVISFNRERSKMNLSKNDKEILIMLVSNHEGPRDLQDLLGRQTLHARIRNDQLSDNEISLLKQIFAQATNLPTDPIAMPLVVDLARRLGVVVDPSQVPQPKVRPEPTVVPEQPVTDEEKQLLLDGKTNE